VPAGRENEPDLTCHLCLWLQGSVPRRRDAVSQIVFGRERRDNRAFVNTLSMTTLSMSPTSLGEEVIASSIFGVGTGVAVAALLLLFSLLLGAVMVGAAVEPVAVVLELLEVAVFALFVRLRRMLSPIIGGDNNGRG